MAVGHPLGSCPFPSVGIDDEHAIGEVMAHLLELGHTRIAMVGGTPGYVHSERRRRAWSRALRRAKLAAGAFVAADFTGPGGAAATRKLLALPEPPTAIVYANDVMAIAGMAVATQARLRVPSDLSVTGFADIPLAMYVSPPITTIREDELAWGRAAAQTLLAIIEGEELPRTSLEPPVLVVRGSTAPPEGHYSCRVSPAAR